MVPPSRGRKVAVSSRPARACLKKEKSNKKTVFSLGVVMAAYNASIGEVEAGGQI